MWILLLLDACERSGVTPLSVERLHRLVYLANTLAPVYDLLVPDGYILKYRRGPFFPAVHSDIGRLVAQGLAKATNIKPIQDDLGYWISADYSLPKAGMRVVDEALSIETVMQKALYLREVRSAFAGLEVSDRDEAALLDVNYDAVAENTAVKFGEGQDNLSPLASEVVSKPADLSIRRIRLSRYLQYLEQAWKQRQGQKICLLRINSRPFARDWTRTRWQFWRKAPQGRVRPLHRPRRRMILRSRTKHIGMRQLAGRSCASGSDVQTVRSGVLAIHHGGRGDAQGQSHNR